MKLQVISHKLYLDTNCSLLKQQAHLLRSSSFEMNMNFDIQKKNRHNIYFTFNSNLNDGNE
jgi:hypothetical protein